MFNKSYRKGCIERLERKQNTYTNKHKSMCNDASFLYEDRKGLQRYIDFSLGFINKVKNKPIELNTEVEKIKIETSRFIDLEKLMNDKAKSIDFKAGGSAGAGIAAGAGVAALGPTAAMGIAMTFGTASTGTAITALYGAAATNAALAWLGGGTILAGGGGMAGGGALLALAGPLGWAIGGASLLGAGVFSNSKNKKVAAEALSKTSEIEAEIRIVDGLRAEMKEIRGSVKNNGTEIVDMTRKCEEFGENYAFMDTDQKYQLGALVNNIFSASKLLNRGIGDNK